MPNPFRFPLPFWSWLLTISALLIGLPTHAQNEYQISAGGVINTCGGVLHDSGGPGGPYGNNENFTITICPENEGDAIFLTWVVWDLNPSGPPNNQDRIRIWDGNSTAGTYLGEYNSPPQGGVASATTFNPTGCLTIQFISNSSGTGNFAAAITCYTPCDRPMASAVMSEAVPALVCIGEEIQFDGSGSYAAEGFDIVEYTWIFDDGDSASGPLATHAFSEPGEYIVQLNLLDDNGCVNSNVVDLQVLVSTVPVFNAQGGEVCLGAAFDLNGTAVQSMTWTGMPDASYGDGVYLPDSLGVPFNSPIQFTQFEPGQTLTNVNDLLSVCVSMEHSYMGDLVISLTCPNGNSMIFHQQGGGGLFLGDANDNDNNQNASPGVCWDYCWTPTATAPTWANASAAGGIYTTPAPSTNWANSLVPGNYSSVQPFSNLLGCPLNGTWTFTIVDLWGADNGFLCNWALNFSPDIIPDVTQFTPVIGLEPDSAFWTGPGLPPGVNAPIHAGVVPPEVGTHAYVFSVTNNFGCSFDTTVFVTVTPPIPVNAGPDQELCNGQLQLSAAPAAQPNNCLWSLVMQDSFGDGWNGCSVTITTGGNTTTHTLNTGSAGTVSIPVNNGDPISLSYTIGNWNNEVSYTLFDDTGTAMFSAGPGPTAGNVYNAVVVCGGIAPLSYIWSPANAVSDPSIPDPLTNVSQSTTFVVSAFPIGFPECATTDTVLVFVDPAMDPGQDSSIVLCANLPPFALTDMLGGTPVSTGTWTGPNGMPVPLMFNPYLGPAGIYTYTVTNSIGCVTSAQLAIELIPVSDPSCCGVAYAGPDTVLCELAVPLLAIPGPYGSGYWSGPSDAVFSDAQNTSTSVSVPSSGSYTFHWLQTDGEYCNLEDSVTVVFTTPMAINLTTTDAICYQACDGTATTAVSGGNPGNNGFTYHWSNGLANSSSTSSTAICYGQYLVQATDTNGCFADTLFFIDQPVLLQIDSMRYTMPTCYGGNDGRVMVYDAEAVVYSYDAGATYVSNSVLDSAKAGHYHVRIKNMDGCVGSGIITVQQPPEVIAHFGWNPDPTYVTDTEVDFFNYSQHAVRYEWDFNTLGSSTEISPVFTFPFHFPGDHQVCLRAFDANECADTLCVNLTVQDVLSAFMPNAFTPNGDGVNETYGLHYNFMDMRSFNLRIFDRWGHLVFEADDPNIHWDGTYRNGGRKLPGSVYTWQMVYDIISSNEERELHGFVNLIR